MLTARQSAAVLTARGLRDRCVDSRGSEGVDSKTECCCADSKGTEGCWVDNKGADGLGF